MYYMYQPNQNYFNGEKPTYGGNPQLNNYQQIGYQGYNNCTPQPLLQNNYYSQPQQQPNYGNMGGYYNGGYYNPYAYRQAQQQYEQQQKQQSENMFNVMKSLVRMAYGQIGQTLTDEELDLETKKRFYPQQYQQSIEPELSEEEREFNRVNEANMSQVQAKVVAVNNSPELYYLNNTLYNIQKTYEADNLFDWMTKFDEETKRQEQLLLERQSKDLSGMYDSNRYNSLLQSHENIAALKSTVNVDDLSVELPAHLKNSYSERRQAFLNAILSNIDR